MTLVKGLSIEDPNEAPFPSALTNSDPPAPTY